MNALTVFVDQQKAGRLTQTANESVFYYDTVDETAVVSLTMPVRAKTYSLPKLLPIFEMHLPEGYLLAVIKKHFAKLTNTDDFGLLSLLSPSVRGRLHYDATTIRQETISLSTLLAPQSKDLFQELVARFALQSPLSGVQPKVLAQVEDKATLRLEEMIVKAWGEDYPELALNEFLCMTAVKNAGVPVPHFYLSADDKLFIMKRFDVTTNTESPESSEENPVYLGFEDMCVLQAKSREAKYQGSYEQLAKSIKLFVSPVFKRLSLQNFFKMMVLNNLLQNGDAHLKNFGVIYHNTQDVRLAPAYDIVSTTAYLKHDVPALTLAGSKRWHNKRTLLRFGIDVCELSLKEAETSYIECVQGVMSIRSVIEQRLAQTNDDNKRHLLEHLQRLVGQAEVYL